MTPSEYRERRFLLEIDNNNQSISNLTATILNAARSHSQNNYHSFKAEVERAAQLAWNSWIDDIVGNRSVPKSYEMSNVIITPKERDILQLQFDNYRYRVIPAAVRGVLLVDSEDGEALRKIGGFVEGTRKENFAKVIRDVSEKSLLRRHRRVLEDY